MTRLLLEIPDDLSAKLEATAAAAGHASVADYVRELLREHADADEQLEAELLRRLDDPRPDIEATPPFWQDLKQRARERRQSGQS